LARGRNPQEVETKLLKRVPARYAVDAHHWLILHGRYICLARKPRCTVCAVRAFCDEGTSTIRP
jgi:endonuclease-3